MADTPALTPPTPVSVDALEADKKRDIQTAQTRQTELDTQRATTAKQEEAELRPLEDAASKATGELQGLKPPTPTQLPEWKPKPIVDAHEYQNYSMAMIGLALIGGVVSKGNWMGVGASLNGAMQGYLDGSKTRADKEFQDYQTKYKEALAHDQQAQKEFEEILTNKQNSINSMLAQVKIAAAKYGREDIRQAADQKSIDAIWKQVEATDRAIAQVQQHNDSLATQFALGKARLDKPTGGPGMDLNAPANANAKWFVEQTMAGGNDKYEKELQSRYGGPIAMAVFNDIGAQFQAQNLDPRTMTQAQLDNQVQLSTQRQISQRTAGVERLTQSITQIEGEVTRLVTKINSTDPKVINSGFNAIANAVGDENVSELRLLLSSMGRQYIEAVTMPGSNAQLHATAQEWAEGQFDPNMNIAMLKGTLKGMNFEIAATSKALHDTQAQSAQRVSTQGPTIAPPGGAPPGAGIPGAPGGSVVPPGNSPPAQSTPAVFKSEADAQAAAAAGTLKPGTKITVGGVSGTWQQ